MLLRKHPYLFSIRMVLMVLMLTPWLGLAQEKEKVQKVNLRSADRGIVTKINGESVRRLIGNVKLQQGNTIMTCDSADLYTSTNTVEAFGHVRINEGDSLNLYGDTLFYDGNTKKARVRGNVRLEEKDMTLTTNYLDYDRLNDVANYYGGGRIVSGDGKSTLTSEIGYYYPKSKDAYFKDSVRMVNKSYTIDSDTLRYNTGTEVTYFIGPTYIRSKDNLIYCEDGWYNSQTDKSEFTQNAYIQTKTQRMEGDSIVYDSKLKIGQAFENVSIADSTDDLLVEGDYAIHYDEDSTSMVTGHALLTQLMEGDSLFLHADTLFATYDSTRQHRIIKAFYHAKFFKSDMQGKSDSLIFSDADSTIYMYGAPILWSDENQITGDSIRIMNVDGKIDSMYITNKAFIISQEDSTKYNQIKGKNMLGTFKDNRLRRVDVNGNGQTVYYAKDGNKMIGVNTAKCSDMIIHIDSNKVEEITFLKNPDAILYPLDKAPAAELILKEFRWYGEYRPARKEHVFFWDSLPPDSTLPPLPGSIPDSLALDTLGQDSLKDDPKIVDPNSGKKKKGKIDKKNKKGRKNRQDSKKDKKKKAKAKIEETTPEESDN